MSDTPKSKAAPEGEESPGAANDIAGIASERDDVSVPQAGPNDNFPNSSSAFLKRMGATHVYTYHPVKRSAHDAERVARLTAELPNQDFYFSPGEVIGAPSDTPTKLQMAGSRWAWIDLDPPKPAPSGFDLDAWRADACARIQTMWPPPTLIVDSGRGYWAYFALDRLYETQEVEAANIGLAAAFSADSCHSIQHVARLPGTINRKTGRMARVLEDHPDRVYRIDDLPKGEAKNAVIEQQVDIGDAIRVNDLGALPGVQRRALVAIAQGSDPDKPLKNDNTRSGWLHYVLCELARANVRPEVALGIITDAEWPISGHILDPTKNGGDAERHARKQIKKAYARVAEERKSAEPQNERASVISIAPVDRDALPERAWLVKDLLLCGNVTVGAARGGAGKSLFGLHLAIMCAVGDEWAYWKSRYPAKTLILNAEDDLHEMQRLLSACDVMGVDQTALADKVMKLRATGFTLFARNEEGKIAQTPFYQELVRMCRDNQIGLLIVDPLVETHAGLDENSNTDMKDVIVGLRSLARQLQIPVLVVHHSRKGQQAGDQDTARGGSAIVNASRITFTLDPMSEDEAKLLPRTEQAERWRYTRFNTAKANYSGRATDQWLRLDSVFLGNGGSPEGDSSPGMRAVNLSEAGALDRERLVELLRAVRDAADAKAWWRHVARGERAGRLDAEIEGRFGMSAPQAKALVQQLLSEGWLRIEQVYSPKAKREIDAVVVGRWPEAPVEDAPF